MTLLLTALACLCAGYLLGLRRRRTHQVAADRLQALVREVLVREGLAHPTPSKRIVQ